MSNESILNLDSLYPKQIEFFKSEAKYTAYGGARGGGKSHALRNKALLLCMAYEGLQVLLVRRTLKDLRKNHEIPLMRQLKTELKTKRLARYEKQNKEFHFPNGSILSLGYAATDADLEQYQGQSYDVVCVEEATQFTETQLRTLTECNRRSGFVKGDFKTRTYYTCNPGGRKMQVWSSII